MGEGSGESLKVEEGVSRRNCGQGLAPARLKCPGAKMTGVRDNNRRKGCMGQTHGWGWSGGWSREDQGAVRRIEERQGDRGDPKNSHLEGREWGSSNGVKSGGHPSPTHLTLSPPFHPITPSQYVTVVGLSPVTSQGETWKGKGGTADCWRGTAPRGTKTCPH